MNPWGIPCRGCDLLAGQIEYALRFRPASFHLYIGIRTKDKRQMCKSVKGAESSISGAAIANKGNSPSTILARSCEAGRWSHYAFRSVVSL
jgi:hypothetical protein